MGSCAIQLAAATGFDVAATASKNNVEHCKVLGAKYVFDYGQEDVVEEIARGLSGKTLVGGFSTMYGRLQLTCSLHQITDSMQPG